VGNPSSYRYTLEEMNIINTGVRQRCCMFFDSYKREKVCGLWNNLQGASVDGYIIFF